MNSQTFKIRSIHLVSTPHLSVKLMSCSTLLSTDHSRQRSWAYSSPEYSSRNQNLDRATSLHSLNARNDPGPRIPHQRHDDRNRSQVPTPLSSPAERS